MTDNLPLVSVIIPTFNRADLLELTLETVIKQTYQNWECIIVNDNSEERYNKIEELAAGDDRLKYFNRPKEIPKGSNYCRNYGFCLSEGAFIQWLDDDDLLMPNKIEEQIKILTTSKSQEIFTTCPWDHYWLGKKLDLKNIEFENNDLPIELFFEKIFERQTFIPPHAYLIPRKLALKAGDWNVNLSINQDAEYFTRILINSKKIINSEQTYVLYRMHQGDRISSKINSRNLNSLLYSFQLINSHLKAKGIQANKYFKWKLLKLLLNFWKTDKEIIKNYSSLFSENNIYLSFIGYYQLKYRIYKITQPYLKKTFLKN